MTRRPPSRAPRGFTLIETVAAVVVMALALPPMLWAIGEAQARRADSILASRARWLAQSRMEDVVADRHSRSGDRGYDWLAAVNYPGEDPVAAWPQFSRQVAFSETGPPDNATPPGFDAGTGYMHVTVTVSWTDSRGNESSLAVTTVLTEYAP
jgi:prepilin-type N-terminal cleavage/methylation domain-containing protein